MSKPDDRSSAEKISEPFRKRLRKLGPEERIRAVVLIRTGHQGNATGRRQSREERQAMVDAIQRAAASALEELDRILDRHDGRRLAESVNALGCIPIEATREGVLAVAESDLVEAVLEDQPISLLKRPSLAQKRHWLVLKRAWLARAALAAAARSPARASP